MKTFALPADVTARLHVHPGTPFPYMVCVTRPPIEATPTAIVSGKNVCASLTHDEGLSWPDRRGEALVLAVLEECGGAMLAFATMGDALACMRRVKRGG